MELYKNISKFWKNYFHTFMIVNKKPTRHSKTKTSAVFKKIPQTPYRNLQYWQHCSAKHDHLLSDIFKRKKRTRVQLDRAAEKYYPQPSVFPFWILKKMSFHFVCVCVLLTHIKC